MEKILSIVVPTYNMEKYLSRCLDSVISDEVMSSVEIIVVNDGSKDGSLEIANKYQAKYPKTVVVVDKQNGNYGSCVNQGLKIATGRFFRILDADDWFESNEYVQLVNELKNIENDVDAVFTNYSLRYFEGQSQTISADSVEYNIIYEFGKLDFCDLNISDLQCMHSISYRLSFLKKIGLMLQEGISYTDIEFTHFPLSTCNKIKFLNINLYQYFLGREGQTMSQSSLVRNKMHLYKVCDRVINDFTKLEDDAMKPFLKKNLSQVLKHPLHSFYLVVLILEDKCADDIVQLKSFEKKYKNTIIYDITSKFTYKKIPFVKIWRYLGIRCSLIK